MTKWTYTYRAQLMKRLNVALDADAADEETACASMLKRIVKDLSEYEAGRDD